MFLKLTTQHLFLSRDKMGFGEAFINVQLIYQRIFDMPWFYDQRKETLCPNPKLKTPWKMAIWNLMKIGLALSIIVCTYRCHQIMHTYKQTRKLEPEEFCITIFSLAMVIQAAVTVFTMENGTQQRCYINSEIFNLGGIHYKGWPSSKRLPDLPELIGYGMAGTFFNFPIFCAIYPLLRSYDPLNMVLINSLSELPRRLLAAGVYAVLVFFAASTCAAFLLHVLAAVYVFEKKAEINYKLSVGESTCNTTSPLELAIQKMLKKVFLLLEKVIARKNSKIKPDSKEVIPSDIPEIKNSAVPSGLEASQKETNLQESLYHRFKIRRKRHIEIGLLMETTNKGVETFVPTTTAVGMTICVTLNYILLTMYDEEDFRLFVGPSISVLVSINALILFLCKHASLPLTYTSETILFWKGQLTGRLGRKQVYCMRPTGLKFGKYYFAKRDTALEINDAVVNATITLLLG
ncbi:unnamed protein product [Orchesella dallaii]|uniref:Uncharacterized protein n=1 Tax=Orchesella dallaii TaxID=48710 RepID=A0ABP1QV43_9HEXA